MSTISAKIIFKPRKEFRCGSCNKFLRKGNPHLRLYGAAHWSDPPYVLRCCFSCAQYYTDPKIVEVTEAYNQSLNSDGASLAR